MVIIFILLVLVFVLFLGFVKCSLELGQAKRVIKLKNCDISCLKSQVMELEKENENLKLRCKQLASANDTGYQGH